MKTLDSKTALIAASFLAATFYQGGAFAYYSASGVLDPAGNNPSATTFATVRCFDDGHGAPVHLLAAVQDTSGKADKLHLSFQLFKDRQTITVTDQNSGDGDGGWSQIIGLRGGAGIYHMALHKTNFGSRNFTVGWQCQAEGFVDTGTEIVDVPQIQ